MKHRLLLLVSALFGLLSVLLGAFGAHALKETLEATGTVAIWNTAVQYNMLHAVLAFCVSLLCTQNEDTRWLSRATVCWLMGIMLFSGSLYGLSLGGPKILGPITPLGGLFLITGWVMAMFHGIKTGRTRKN